MVQLISYYSLGLKGVSCFKRAMISLAARSPDSKAPSISIQLIPFKKDKNKKWRREKRRKRRKEKETANPASSRLSGSPMKSPHRFPHGPPHWCYHSWPCHSQITPSWVFLTLPFFLYISFLVTIGIIKKSWVEIQFVGFSARFPHHLA